MGKTKVDQPFMVVALKDGYYGNPNRRIAEGGKFMCLKEEDFSKLWMKRVGGKPEVADNEGEGDDDVVLLADEDGAIRDAKIVKALNKLDHGNDDHWTSKGLPSMDVLREALDASITRAHVEAACPGFLRQ